jgi:sugar phosphate isomerase/epimerase
MAATDIRPGLVSITFRNLSPEELIQEVARAGLEGIEWGGDVHVPHGDIARAEQVEQWTRDAGLEVAAYGSYYRAGETDENPDFQAVLDSARALNAPTIRVWAGKQGSADAAPDYRQQVMSDLERISTLADAEGLRICLEYHGGTLTDDSDSALALLNELPLRNLDTLWQPPNGQPDDHCEQTLKAVLPRVSNLHVFHWGPGGWNDRRPLSEGTERWTRFFNILDSSSADRWALMEFVKNDSLDQFHEDAGILNRLLASS